jgi:coenzyme F420-reducing hydrogenase gamma subunit
MVSSHTPTVAVYKFSSCDGCQLSLLNLEDELLTLAHQLTFAYFLEASRETTPGPYDIALVEGSVTTPEEAERIQTIRHQAKTLIALGTCATSGGIQALRNLTSVDSLSDAVYPHPEWLDPLDRVSPISDHVTVDYELWGCPVDKHQLLELFQALVAGRRPVLSRTSVCAECKRRNQVCILVAEGVPCLGPITRAGCGALCPGFGRGCYGCFGPLPEAQGESMLAILDASERHQGEIRQLLQHVNCNAPGFRTIVARRLAEAKS